MKKKSIMISITVLIIVILGVWAFTRPRSLGNIYNNCSEPTTKTSIVSFSGETGGRIRFSFRSKVDNGALDIILYDPEGKKIYELDRAKELECFYTLDKTGVYTLAAKCDSFIGNYKVDVYKAD